MPTEDYKGFTLNKPRLATSETGLRELDNFKKLIDEDESLQGQIDNIVDKTYLGDIEMIFVEKTSSGAYKFQAPTPNPEIEGFSYFGLSFTHEDFTDASNRVFAASFDKTGAGWWSGNVLVSSSPNTYVIVCGIDKAGTHNMGFEVALAEVKENGGANASDPDAVNEVIGVGGITVTTEIIDGRKVVTLERSFFFNKYDADINAYSAQLSGFDVRLSNVANGVLVVKYPTPDAQINDYSRNDLSGGYVFLSNEVAALVVVTTPTNPNINGFSLNLYRQDFSNNAVVRPN